VLVSCILLDRRRHMYVALDADTQGPDCAMRNILHVGNVTASYHIDQTSMHMHQH